MLLLLLSIAVAVTVCCVAPEKQFLTNHNTLSVGPAGDGREEFSPKVQLYISTTTNQGMVERNLTRG